MQQIITKHWLSPLGLMILGDFNGELCLADWVDSPKRSQIDRRICKGLDAKFAEGDSPIIGQTILQLKEYFSKQRREFSLPLRMVGTDFQQRVWQELLYIPYGTTISYGEQARRMGAAPAVRAVASANGSNPITIIVPCHRVIGANQKLTGYTGGLHIKQALLQLEIQNTKY